MLAKIEHVYLSILRVVILISATVALIVAGFGLASSIPSMLRWAGISQPAKAMGGNLREFVAEHNISGTNASADSESTAVTYDTLPRLQKSAEIIKKYLGSKGTITERDWRILMQKQADTFTTESSAYADSVLHLAEELKASAGKPLSEPRVLELMDWNTNRFRADLEAKRGEEAAQGATFWVKLAAAGTGFLAFVGIVFIFLFVKIERNLRPNPRWQTTAEGENDHVS